MAYRVYDNEKKVWLKNDIYLNPDGELFKIKKSVFGMVRVPLALNDDKYVWHKDIGLADKHGVNIFEGDYIRAVVGKVDEDDENSEDKIEIGIVVYAYELSAYVILCGSSSVFYTLGSAVSNELEVIGNVFDGYEK